MPTSSPSNDYLRLLAHCNSRAKMQPIALAVRAKLIELDLDATGDFGDYLASDPISVNTNFSALNDWIDSIVPAADLSDDDEIALNAINIGKLRRFASCLGVALAAPATDLEDLT